MSHVAPGRRVHVEFDGKVEEFKPGDALETGGTNWASNSTDPWGFLKVRDANGTYHMVWNTDRVVTDLGPAEPRYWPPTVGEVWQTKDGVNYFVTIYGGENHLELIPADRTTKSGTTLFYHDNNLADFLKLEPRRIFGSY